MRLSETSSALERLGKILFQQECLESWRGKISETELFGLLGAVDRHIQDQAGLFRRFTAIGLSLSKEKNIMDILEKILTFARELTNADAGTLYLLDQEKNRLNFEIIQNDSMNLDLRRDRSAMDKFSPVPLEKDGEPNIRNVSSYVALYGKKVNIPDVYKTDGFDFSGTRSYDNKSGYRSRSMLVLPMQNHEERIIGVLQIINATRPDTNEIVAFSPEHEEIVRAMASQAAIVLTKTQLIQDLEDTLNSLKIMHHREKAALEEKSVIELQRAESLNNLALSIAHQIRNPIMTIGGFINLARKNLDNPEKIANYLDYIFESAGRLQSMARSVDEYASIGSSRPRKITLASFVLPACERILDKAGQRGLSLEIVREAALEQSVIGDPHQLGKAVEAVLENSLDAGNKNTTPCNTVRVSIHNADGRIKMFFSDQGQGITDEVMPYVFDPFFTTRAHKAGMGLTIAHRILNVNKGELDIESPGGKGVNVSLNLPAWPGSSD